MWEFKKSEEGSGVSLSSAVGWFAFNQAKSKRMKDMAFYFRS